MKNVLEKQNQIEMIQYVAEEMVASIDVELKKLENEFLQKRIDSDPALKNVEITPELREQLLEEIREYCLSLEE